MRLGDVSLRTKVRMPENPGSFVSRLSILRVVIWASIVHCPVARAQQFLLYVSDPNHSITPRPGILCQTSLKTMSTANTGKAPYRLGPQVLSAPMSLLGTVLALTISTVRVPVFDCDLVSLFVQSYQRVQAACL